MSEVVKFLSRDEVFAADDVEYVEIAVPEWGGTIRLRNLTADQAVAFVDTAPEQRASLLPRLVCESAVDDDGKPLFRPGDHERLKGKSLRAFMRLGEQVLKINGLSKEDKDGGNAESEASLGASPIV